MARSGRAGRAENDDDGEWQPAIAALDDAALLLTTSPARSTADGSGHPAAAAAAGGAAAQQPARRGIKRPAASLSGDPGRPFRCPHPGCGAAFKKAAKLERHARTHTGERPWLCPEEGCGKSYGRQEHLTRHMRSHTGERPYACDFPGCSMAFGTSHHLKRHRELHTQEGKPFKCTVVPGCTAAFTKRSRLLAHEARHLGKKACPCTVDGCSEAFDYPSQLREHTQRKHSAPSREPRFVCGHTDVASGKAPCLKAFHKASELRHHRLTEHPAVTRFVCEEEGCERSFERKTQLQAHHRKCHASGAALAARTTFSCPDPQCAKIFTKKVRRRPQPHLLFRA